MQLEIIAEVAQAHEGSLGIAHSYIDALSETGVNTVKFQMHIADAESSEYEKFRVNFSYEDISRFDYWKRMEFTFEQWAGLKEHCEEKNMRFLCSPFSIEAVKWLEQLKVERYKIASGETENYLMLEFICNTGKPILLSSGMSSFDELDETIKFIKNRDSTIEGIFQCTTYYPTPAEKYGLNIIQELKNRYGCKVGLSDHSGEIFAPLAAVALGAELIETHVVFDKKMFGPDAKSSLNISEFKQLVNGLNKIGTSLQNDVNKNDNSIFNELKIIFGKSLAVNKNLKQGDTISIEDLESKKPGNMGIPAKYYISVLGRKLTKFIERGDFLNENDLV